MSTDEPEPDRAADDEAQYIGSYHIIREIGRGGMGTIYLAEHKDDPDHKPVAVKRVRPDLFDDEMLQRFRHEWEILARLDHPNIAGLLDGDVAENGQHYLVMEHVNGKPVDVYCDEKALSISERLKLFYTACEAVHYAHQCGIIHRDLKPGNILVTNEGVVKLLDFGIAKLLYVSSELQMLPPTGSEMMPMAPEYACPAEVHVDPDSPAVDVFALGLLLYQLLTGHRPFAVTPEDPAAFKRLLCVQVPEKPSQVVKRSVQQGAEMRSWVTPESVCRTRATSLDELCRRLEGELDQIVMRALEKKPADRYPSAKKLADAVQAYLDGSAA